jgi:DNA-binding NarL/FixJ family response regulator
VPDDAVRPVPRYVQCPLDEEVVVGISVFLVDDHEIVRRGVAHLLDAEPDMDVVGEAASATEALARIPAAHPDVAILDVRLPDGEGISVCREVRSMLDPPPACLMLTSYSDDQALFGAIVAGAAGYLLKDVAGTNLVGAVRTAAAGGSLIDPETAARALERLRTPEDPRYESLSPQERRILDLIATGLTNRQIGAELFLAEKTVKNYVSSLLHKLGFARRTEAAVYAASRRRAGRPPAPPPQR